MNRISMEKRWPETDRADFGPRRGLFPAELAREPCAFRGIVDGHGDPRDVRVYART